MRTLKRVTTAAAVVTTSAVGSSAPFLESRRRKGDFGFNMYHNSNPQHGAAYARHERCMREEEFEDFLASVKGWDHDDATHAIWRSFYFATFDEAYRFMGKLYAFCYGVDKYPHITWADRRIDVALYSPSFKGLSKREASVAAFCNDQYNHLKKAKAQSEKLMELGREGSIEKFVGASAAAELARRQQERNKPPPEASGEVRSW